VSSRSLIRNRAATNGKCLKSNNEKNDTRASACDREHSLEIRHSETCPLISVEP